MNTTTSKTQPALIGGLVMGVLSGLPIISAGNLCCCLWIISGGVVAAYLLQQNSETPITQSDGAITGLLAGVIGAGVYLIISIPLLLIVPLQQRMIRGLMDRANNMPPEFRHYMNSYVGGVVGLIIGFMFMLVLGAIFSTIGGLLGATFFRKPLPPADTTPSS